jgi:hypothetical protein
MEDIGKKLANGKALKGAIRGALGITGAKIEFNGMRLEAATPEEIERLVPIAERLVPIAIISMIILREVAQMPNQQKGVKWN